VQFPARSREPDTQSTFVKRDPELDGLLRKHGRALGIAAGSRLDRWCRRLISTAP
jgi:hypothetical protein